MWQAKKDGSLLLECLDIFGAVETRMAVILVDPQCSKGSASAEKGMGNFYGSAEQEEEVPEEEVKAILSRGMQRPKLALQGAWEIPLQIAWTYWHLKEYAAVLPLSKPLRLLVTKPMGL